MALSKDVSGRRFLKFSRGVRLGIVKESADWDERSRKSFKSTMTCLLDNYLSSITSLKHLVKPATFVAGARVLVLEFLRVSDAIILSDGSRSGSKALARPVRAAAGIARTICHDGHVGDGAFCEKCFSRLGERHMGNTL